MSHTIVMLGATGAVGGHVVKTLLASGAIQRLSLLGRRRVEGINASFVEQHTVDVFAPASYAARLPGHRAAICTLGVGEPSKISKEEFVRTDRDAVLAFASASKTAGVEHFQLLSSVGADSRSRSFYLQTKGELEDGIRALAFKRLSLFQPSMIMTPTNRYGLSQAFFLRAMPLIDPLLIGSTRKFRSVQVETLGRVMAVNALRSSTFIGVETLRFDEIVALGT